MGLSAKQLLRVVYLNMYKKGFSMISLKSNDISTIVPRIEVVLNKYGIDSDDLFVKTPVLETYDRYVDYLISIFLQEPLGHMNETYDSITIDCTMYRVDKELEEAKEYSQIIEECCDVIINDEKTPRKVLQAKKN